MVIPSRTILSICAGIGGLDLGIRLALRNARTICYIERELFAAAVLVKRMQEGILDPAPVWSDIATFNGRPWHRKVYILAGGIPCQPWSCAGNRQGIEDDRWIWKDVLRIVRQVKPPIVFLENVPGFTRGGLERILADLAALGFDAEWGVFSAGEVGAPHRRERLFILATMEDAGRIRFQGGNQSEDDWNTYDAGRILDNNQRQKIFPPGPGEDKKWKKFKTSGRPLKPTLRRGDPGASKVVGMPGKEGWDSQIRGLGNTVVPLTAALAFGILGERIGLIEL